MQQPSSSGAASSQDLTDVLETLGKSDDVVGQAARVGMDQSSTHASSSTSSAKFDVTHESSATPTTAATDSQSVHISQSSQAFGTASSQSSKSSATQKEQATSSASKGGQQSKQTFSTSPSAKKPVLAPPIQQVSHLILCTCNV
jgi:hypothetical protein